MSNRASITSTHFVNPVTKDVCYGVRVCDDYGHGFIDWWSQEELPEDPIELLKKVWKYQDETIRGVLEWLQENHIGLYINDKWFEWEEIAAVFEEEEEETEK